MITTTIVGGFLGAGKTTWLRSSLQELIRGADPATVAVLVNDFADQGVDDGLLAQAAPHGVEVHAITSGCICCDRLEDLVSYLQSAVEASHRPGGGAVQRLIIETSGMADPAPIIAAVEAHPVLRRNIRVEELIVIVDGQNALSQFRHHPLPRAQLMSADRVVISKADIGDPRQLARLRSAIALINPGAGITGASRGQETPLPEVDEHLPFSDEQLWADGANPRPTATVMKVAATVDWEEFALWFDALIGTNADRVLRSKGTVMTAAGPLVLQSVGPTIPAPLHAPQPAGENTGPTALVFITCGIDPDSLRESFRTHVPTGIAD